MVLNKIYTNKNQEILIDEEDYSLVSQYTWFIHYGYATTNKRIKKGKQFTLKMHRLLMNVNKTNIYVDHINGNTLDNRKENLRICTSGQNQGNRKKGINNKLGFKGVAKVTNCSKFQAHICKDFKKIYLGSFSTPEEAAKEYDKKAIELFGEFAQLNFPRENYV